MMVALRAALFCLLNSYFCILGEPAMRVSHQVLGDCSEGDPPVPIPNTEVKPFSPDGTARASVWESRTLPR